MRLLYGYPTGITDNLLKTMTETAQVCRYFDIPIQHSHPDILRAMKRGGIIEHARNMARRIRNVMPDATLRTTCLVGFPGEQEKHFDHLLDFIVRMEFDHLGIFTYSPEDGTAAAGMADHVENALAEERRNRILTAQKEVVDRKAAALIGKEAEVLLEKSAPDCDTVWQGRSRRLAPEVDGAVIVASAGPKAKTGDFVKVRYTWQLEYDMQAVVIDSGERLR